MVMPQTVPWTREDLDRLPDDGNRYEVLNGELLVTPAPSAFHQHIVAWLNAALTPYVATHRIGRVHQPRSVIVIDGSQVEPDLMVLPARAFDTWENAPTPILVVEVLSKSTRRRDLHGKREFYLEKGIDEYWVVDRYSRSVIRFRRGESATATATLTWAPSPGAPPLEMDIAAMFAGIKPGA